MLYEVSLTKDAERDLEENYLHTAEHDSQASADHVLDRLVKATEALKTSPDRGSYVNELRSLGISEYRLRGPSFRNCSMARPLRVVAATATPEYSRAHDCWRSPGDVQ